MLLKDKVQQSLEVIRSKLPTPPFVAVVLGSGMGSVADQIQNPIILPTNEIPHYPVSTVPGHSGRWIFGDLDGVPTLCIQGRVHFYEGYSLEQVTYYIHLLAGLGVRYLFLTTACGGLHPEFQAGDLMLMTDQINFAFNNPLIGQPENQLGPRFPDMSQPFDPELLQIAENVGLEFGHPFRKGVFFWVTGPNYETVAEVRAFRKLGGDAVSMSTAPEVIVAKQRFLRVLGIALITNLATAPDIEPLTHREVTEMADRAGKRLSLLLGEIIHRTRLLGD